MKYLAPRCLAASFIFLLLVGPVFAGQGKLLATAGLTQLEGSAGGGIVPWATIAGYDSRDEVSVSIFRSQVDVDDYRLNAFGVAAGLFDRVEFSLAKHKFDLKGAGAEIEQNLFGLKVRLYGDVVYSTWPQLSLGIQHKKLSDGAIARAVGADHSHSGTDYYLAMTKVHLGAVGGYNLVWNLTARATKANQLGLLGYGGVNNDSHELMLEGSIGLLLSRELAIGFEYRQKPDNLAIKEDDWMDVFITYMPNKHVNLTAAWTELGDIAGAEDQQGVYFSITGYLW